MTLTWSAAAEPRPHVAATQRWALAAGAIALVVGRETGQTELVVAGAAGGQGSRGGRR